MLTDFNFEQKFLKHMYFNTSRGFNPSPAPEVPRHSEVLTLSFYIAESSMKSLWHWKDDTAALKVGSDKQHPTAHSGPWFEEQHSRAHTHIGHDMWLFTDTLWLQGIGSCRKGCSHGLPVPMHMTLGLLEMVFAKEHCQLAPSSSTN